MLITELVNHLERVKSRFGNIEVRAGSASITRLAVLPYAAIEPANNGKQPDMHQFVALLVRHGDQQRPLPEPTNGDT